MSEPDVLAHARALLAAAEAALVQMRTVLAAASRHPEDPRERTRLLTPARRLPDEIHDLAALDADTLVTVRQLAVYWAPCHHNSVLYWIRTRRLPAQRHGRTWLIRAGDARAFEPRIYSHTQSRLTRTG